MSGALNWNDVRELGRRVLEEGGPLLLSDEVRAILRRTAREVAIDANEAEQALRAEPEATALLKEMTRRIRDGSHRLSRALAQMYRLRDAGDLEGARQQMREVLAVEVVPHYRAIAETSLESLDDPESE
ncbi:DUSAM domain-containing protein [Stigmatella hybrida]|uniref:DUSAM domain-containing protein n=1 Tax=Stigmatella hybrida TaxID=394097 RepID=UPI001CDB04BA|nr:DUSAM domain-containing protein [Stigmatella hybrida]